jgi:hypothetical protein
MKVHYVVSAAILAAMMTAAQVQAEPSTTDKVKTWTRAEWNKSKAEFAKDKDKWASCRKEGRDKKLRGKASWSFLYDCMKT